MVLALLFSGALAAMDEKETITPNKSRRTTQDSDSESDKESGGDKGSVSEVSMQKKMEDSQSQMTHSQMLAGETLLHMAASRGELAKVRILVVEKADVNCVDEAEQTPLFKAVKNGHLNVCQYLVAQQALINIKDTKQCPPIFYAINQKDTTKTKACDKITDLLLKNGAEITAIPTWAAATRQFAQQVQEKINKKRKCRCVVL